MSDYNAKEEKIIEMIKDLIRRGGISYQLIVGRFESKILNLKNSKLSYWFVLNINGANVRAHGRVIINSGDPELNYIFVRDVKGADVRAHGQAIINSGDPKWNYLFAEGVKGADVKAYEQVVFKYGNQIESELESLDNYLDDAVASSEKDASKSMTK